MLNSYILMVSELLAWMQDWFFIISISMLEDVAIHYHVQGGRLISGAC